MTATRSRKQEKVYAKYLQSRPKNAPCQFCAINKSDDSFIESTKNFKVIRNIYGYSVWDSQEVTDHLMLLPIKHTDTLNDIGPKASEEFLKLLGTYEQNGYNVYARAPSSNMKSVIHQHTHLIKLNGKRKKLFMYLRKPYIRITR